MSTIAESDRLDWTGALEQAVIGIHTYILNWELGEVSTSQIWILSFSGNDNLSFDIVTQQPAMQQTGSKGDDNCFSHMRGLAIGNFDRPSRGEPATFPGSLGIAVVQGYPDCPFRSSLDWFLQLWTVDPSDFSMTGVYGYSGVPLSSRTNEFVLLGADWQGGSLWVGPPEIVPLQDLAQLEVALQAPPMHMDYIQPIDETSADLLNLSFGLPGFNTKFTESSGTTTSTSHQSTTSHSFAEKESLEDSLSFGVPDVASVSVDLSTSSEQTQQQVVSQSSTTITSTLSSLTTASDLDDRLWYTAHDTDLYIYPVLCPPDPNNANECGTTPSHVMFSIPQSQKVYSFVPGSAVEWYQPPHQVAQALSYPWTKAQLAALFPSATLDTKLEVDNLPAAGPLNTTFEWTTVGTTTDSIGKTRTLSFDTSVSISTDVNAEIDIFSLGSKTKESFSFNTSSSANTVNTSGSKITGSIGFATSVPDAADLRSGSNPDYAYDFDVMVFGQKHPPCGTASAEDQEPTSNGDEASSSPTCIYDDRTLTEEITTQGTLWAGYTIDLSSGGSWWSSPNTDYFTLHDIALGHPQRWVRDTSQSSGENCLLDSPSSTQLCYAQSATSLEPDDIWTNERMVLLDHQDLEAGPGQIAGAGK